MGQIAMLENDKIKRIISLKHHSSMSLSLFNDKLREKGSKVFLQDKLNLSERGREGTPEVGQIIIGVQFWHYQTHIGVITDIKEDYQYTNLTVTNDKKGVPLEWNYDVPPEKIDKINRELDLAIEIAESFVKKRKDKEKELKEKEISLENEKIKKALEMI